MQIINQLNNINSILADLIANDEYTSIGYVPILNSITATDIITIKNAKKLLDVIVVHNISNQKFDDFTLKALEQLDPNLIIELLEEETTDNNLHISLSVQSVNSINLLKAILAVLPSSVFINNDNFEVFKAISILENNFKNLFSLHNIQTPESLKSFKELEAISILQALEKSKQEINKISIIKALSDFSVSQYQEFIINNNLYVNLNLIHKDTLLNISYTFKV